MVPSADTVIAGAGVAARARRHGPLPWSALGPGPRPALPPGAADWASAEIDRLWGELDRPDPFVVVEPGGRLGAEVLARVPGCAAALRWLLVSPPTLPEGLALEDPAVVLGPALVADDPDEAPAPAPGTGPAAAVVGALPAGLSVAVVLAFGEVARLPADRYEWRDGRWWELRLAAGDGDGHLRPMMVQAPPRWDGVAPAPGPVRDAAVAQRWLVQARRVARLGRVLVVDDPTAAPPPVVALRPAPRSVVSLSGDLSPLIASTWTMIGSGRP